jgi:YidC/Oxa1 family membrane protein insertase
MTGFSLFAFIFAFAFFYNSSFSFVLKRSSSTRATSVLNVYIPTTDYSHFETLLDQNSLNLADVVNEGASVYTKVDKTGVIGFFATYIEKAIDLGHGIIQNFGIDNTYGYSIILFTILIKALTLPLTTTQLESTTRMQKLAPLQEKIKARYPNPADEQTRNQLLSQLFQTANVNPLAGCFPALVQIPVFISLYRALQNLVAENKLDEPFLWIPDLQGPTYNAPPGQTLDWIKSVATGEPLLGIHDTLCFLSIPLILYISQSISSKVLQPPEDSNKVNTEQEEFAKGLTKNLPFIIAFFSLNVPAGLALYWIINNVLTTAITVSVKKNLQSEVLPSAVDEMMSQLAMETSTMSRSKEFGTSVSASKRALNAVRTEPVIQKNNKSFSKSAATQASSLDADILSVETVSNDNNTFSSENNLTAEETVGAMQIESNDEISNGVEPKGPIGKLLKKMNDGSNIADEVSMNTESMSSSSEDVSTRAPIYRSTSDSTAKKRKKRAKPQQAKRRKK